MSRSFRRSWSVTIGTTRVRSRDTGDGELSIKFNVKKSLEREPNTAEVRIANMREDRRRQLEQADEPQLEIIAGYVDLTDTIFVGDARDVWSTVEGVDIWTSIEAEDGGRSYRTADYEATFDRNVSCSQVFRGLANAMGVGIGNASSVFSTAELDSGSSIWPQGVTLSGPAWRSMDSMCRSCNLRWSVQNGVLQLRRAGSPAETRALRLTPDTGLIGSPTRGRRDEQSGEVSYSARCLLVPGIYPGRVISVESRALTGFFLAHRVEYTGDSSGVDWYATMELKEYES